MLNRFSGTVSLLRAADVAELVRWVAAIPFADWHQQKPLGDGQLRPAMMTDLGWHGFGAATAPVVSKIMALFPRCSAYQLMMSVVMPGHSIEPHRDLQPPYWVCRIHCPLTSNPESRFIVGGIEHRLDVGFAYAVDTMTEHAVTNDGATPRIHFLFDVRGSNG